MELSSYISNLRIIGLLAGAAMLALSFFRLRKHAHSRADVFAYGFGGVLLIAVSLFPSLVNIPSEMISLNRENNGRIIALVLISVFLLFVFYVDERTKRGILDQQLDKLVRGLAVNDFIKNQKQPIPSPSILLIMPAYNEADNLEHLLPTLPKQIGNLPVAVLLVNDGSADETARVAEEKGAFVLTSPINRGQGSAIRLGYDLISKLKLDGVAVSMDADGQHQASDIPGLIAPILEDKADFVIGSRNLGHRQADSAVRFLGIHVYNTVLNLLTGCSITDCSSGFRAFSLQMIRNIKLYQNQFVAPELIIDASKKGYRITEAPITVTRRLMGTSKKGTNWHYGFNFFRSIVKTWLR